LYIDSITQHNVTMPAGPSETTVFEHDILLTEGWPL